MSWVKMDDAWPFSRKLRYVEPLDRLMWAMAIPYASSQNTDGVLDGPMLETVAFLAGVTKPYEAAERLVKAHLFELDATAEGGAWRVHDFLDWNPSAEQAAERRDRRAEAGRKGGQRSGESRRSKAEAKAEANASPFVQQKRTPSRPVPSDDSLRSSSPGDDDEFEELMAMIGRTLAADGARKNPTGYAKAVATDPTRRDEVLDLIAKNPGKDRQWLHDKHLGRKPAPPICTLCDRIGHTPDRCDLKDSDYVKARNHQ